jgi:hypothetical protein
VRAQDFSGSLHRLAVLVVVAQRNALHNHMPAGVSNGLDKVWPYDAKGPGDLQHADASDGVSRTGADRAIPDYTPVARIDPISPPAVLPKAPTTGSAPTKYIDKIQAAAALYAEGDFAGGDDLAKGVEDPIQRTALSWIALKSTSEPDYNRLAAFGAAHPQWPGNDWIRREQESALYAHPLSVATGLSRRCSPKNSRARQLAN